MKIIKLAEIPVTMAQEAWRLSRDPDVQTPLAEVLAVDAPVNEIPCYVLHFQDFTIIEREIFTSHRNHTVWARTSRVDDPLCFTVPTEFQELVPTATIRQRMNRMKNEGREQDQWRSLLPLVAHTSWVGRLSLRDLAKMAAYFDYLTSKVQSPLRERFARIVIALISLAPANITIMSYKLDLLLNEEPMSNDNGRYKFGTWTFIQGKFSMMLRAQVVRHRPIQFKDNFVDLIRKESIIKQNLQMLVTMELCAPDSFWHHIMSKRACWVAQADIWYPITMFFPDGVLPCIDGHCPYEADNRLRMESKDPNPVCPVFCELNKLDKTPHRKAMHLHARTKPQWWHEHIDRY